MQNAQRQQISKLVNSVRTACELTTTPLDLDTLVARLNGVVRDVPDADFEAMIEKGDPGFVISLGPQPYTARRRFSIAHELGHLFLHMGYLIDEQKWRAVGTYTDSVYYRFGYSTEEYQANEFAAALLMPEAEFRAIAAAHLRNGAFSIPPIAEHFEVSQEAAVNRGRWLGVFSWG